MNKSIPDYIRYYKNQMQTGDIQVAYEFLLRYMMSLKSSFEKTLAGRFSCGNVSPGYMDFSYFPVFNPFLRQHKLRFGIVLNHKEMQFELWLMGQNIDTQEKYWNLMKSTKWNKDASAMPQYAVLKAVLVAHPDFDKTEKLTTEILQVTTHLLPEIMSYITSGDEE